MSSADCRSCFPSRNSRSVSESMMGKYWIWLGSSSISISTLETATHAARADIRNWKRSMTRGKTTTGVSGLISCFDSGQTKIHIFISNVYLGLHMIATRFPFIFGPLSFSLFYEFLTLSSSLLVSRACFGKVSRNVNVWFFCCCCRD